ncbi:MAG: phage head closure protein [Oscillospiraceae bacterium]|nr:phage head closure protein [Oscillospiraceae bacterium]
MNIARLNESILIQKTETVVDRYGNHKPDWTDYFACHASVTGAASSAQNGAQQVIAGQTVDISDVAFTVRWCQKTATVNNTEYRILFCGDYYDILAVDHMNFQRKCVKYRCRKVRR